ncbi:MAG: glutathione S-transferase family protein [Gammaproteobacteria bacterium]|nr:glutathione S-transferase family protein [Gammaproteobacteria bacterium]
MRLFHANLSRSSRILWLLEELELPCEIVPVSIIRRDGSGGRDPRNPHPDGKVPALTDGEALITETIAIVQWLCEQKPDSTLMPTVGHPQRGPWLTWLAWYAGVYEPVIGFHFAGVGDNPVLYAGFRGRAELDERLRKTLASRDWLVGDTFSAADLLFASAAIWAREILPDGDVVDAWLQRCLARPARKRAEQREAALASQEPPGERAGR